MDRNPTALKLSRDMIPYTAIGPEETQFRIRRGT